jgi:superfamily II DNA or RNA helicase
LDLDARKYLTNKYKLEKPGTRYLPAVRLGRWDGKVSFFQISGSTYVNLLPEILEYLDSAGYHIELEDHRPDTPLMTFGPVTTDTFKNVMWPKGHVMEGQPIILRDYQVDIINNFLQNPQSLQQVATGAGKTLMTAALSASIEPYGRSVVIVPNKDLVRQTEADYINLGLDVGVYFGDRKDLNKTHTICTWQSLANLMKLTAAGDAAVTISEFLEGVVCVMVDEVHSAKADALKGLLTGPMSHIPIRWGLTGTVPKEEFEFTSIFISLGHVIGELSASELQDKGVLANCHVKILQMVDHVEFKQYQAELKYLLENKERVDKLVDLVNGIKDTGNTLILVDRISVGKELASRIDGAVFVNGATKSKERKDHYDDVRTSDDKTIVATYGVAAVGINVPRIFNVVLIEPGKSFVRVIQSIGRGIRKAEDKDFVQIWDVTSTCKFAKRHLTKRKAFYKEANYPFSIQKVEWQ